MAVALLRRALGSPPYRLARAAPSAFFTQSRHLSDDPNNSDAHHSQDFASDAAQSALDNGQNRPYIDQLRESLRAKYFSNQPVAKARPLSRSYPSKLGLEGMRVKYEKRVSSIRKTYARQLEKKKTAKAKYDMKQREEILLAKEERLRLKKEKSAQRALEVQNEMQLLQAKLARERAERALRHKEKDKKLEERRQKEIDLIRQQSGTWIEEKDLEVRIIQALVHSIDL